MSKFFSLFSAILLFVSLAAADTTAVATDSAKTSSTDTVVLDTDKANVPSIQELKKKHAVWIKLEGDVEPSMYDFCARAIDDALKEKPDYIVFEINTFGGRLDAAFDLVDTIMAVKDPETIALVKKKAISAGSLIALAC